MVNLFEIKYFIPLFGVFAVIFLLREYFSYKKILAAKYIFTPLVTVAIILTALLSVYVFGLHRYSVLIIMGLVLSLVADTLLMIEDADLFKEGLIFFLMTHLLYTGAFFLGYKFKGYHIILAAGFIIFIVLYYRKLSSSGFKYWVLLYMFVLFAMCFFACSRLDNIKTAGDILVPLGAVLFIVSDFILSINTFIKKIPHSTVLTWTFYAPAQFLIAISCFS